MQASALSVSDIVPSRSCSCSCVLVMWSCLASRLIRGADADARARFSRGGRAILVRAVSPGGAACDVWQIEEPVASMPDGASSVVVLEGPSLVVVYSMSSLCLRHVAHRLPSFLSQALHYRLRESWILLSVSWVVVHVS